MAPAPVNGLKGYADTTLSLYVVPTICKPLSCQPVMTSIEYNKCLLSLELADSAEGDSLSLLMFYLGVIITGS